VPKKRLQRKTAKKPSKVATRVSKALAKAQALAKKRSEAAIKGWETRERKAREAKKLARKRTLVALRGWETRRQNEAKDKKSSRKRVKAIGSHSDKELARKLKDSLNHNKEIVALRKKANELEKKDIERFRTTTKKMKGKKIDKETLKALEKIHKMINKKREERTAIRERRKRISIIEHAAKFFVRYDRLTKKQKDAILQKAKMNPSEVYRLGLYAVKIGYDAKGINKQYRYDINEKL